MKHQTVFHLISSALKEKNVACVMIGGFAVNYYKVTRQTADVDFLITKEDFKKIRALLEKEGYKQDYSQDFFIRLKSNSFYLMDLDFMFVDEETLEKIIKKAKKMHIAKLEFLVPSVEHLIALKLHSIKHNPKLRKNKDLPDIINLINVNKVNVKNKAFKKMCLKYGTKDLYNDILKGA